MAEHVVVAPPIALAPRRPLRRRAWRPLVRNPLATIGLALLLLFALSAVFAPVLAPADPLEQRLERRLQPPSWEHPLGTDQLGRDVLSRLLYGAQISLRVGLTVVLSAGVLGTFVGLIAGYMRGRVDEVLMRVTDVFFAFPPLILAMAIAGALGRSLNNAMIAIAVVTWPVYARLVRGQVLSLREREFVLAAQSVGASTPRILLRHILPNTLSPIFVQASFDMGGAILAAAGLSFIGFGAQPPTPEWGVMISEGRQFISTQFWLSLYPGLAILLTVTAFNLLGDGLRDMLDPQLRGRE
jgi:peptide/nickel transport system permease protein